MLLSEFNQVNEKIMDPREAIIRRALEIIDQDMKNDPRKTKALERYAFDVWRAVGLKNMSPRDLVDLYRNWKGVTEGVGRITAQNKTADVGYDAITKEAAKFGNKVDRDGRPPLLRINEAISDLETDKNDKFGIRFENLRRSGKKVGTINGLEVLYTQDLGFSAFQESPGFMIWDPEAKVVAGVLTIKTNWEAATLHPKTVPISVAAVNGKYEGQGLIFKMYVLLVRKGFALLSDDLQSKGGKKLWAKLAGTPGINVYGVDTSGGTPEFTDVDPGDITDGSFMIYDSDREEWQKLEKQLAALNKQQVYLDDQRRTAKKAGDAALAADLADQLDAMQPELKAMRLEVDAWRDHVSTGRGSKLMAVAAKMATNESKLTEGEYPLEDWNDWEGDRQYKEQGAKIVSMTPEEYLSRVRPLTMDPESEENIDLLVAHVKAGGRLDPLKIYANGKEDGRHRAYAAQALGIKRVPVVLWPQLNEDDLGSWERGKIITPPGNTVGLNVFEIPPDVRGKLNGTMVYHQTKKLDKVLKSGGLRPRADVSGEREFALDTVKVGKDWQTPKGIFVSKSSGNWFGDEISFTIQPLDRIYYAYNKSGHLLITNPIPADRFVTGGPKTESYTPLQMAIMEGGHLIEDEAPTKDEIEEWLASVENEMEEVDDASRWAAEDGEDTADLDRDYQALHAVEMVLRNHLTALRNPVLMDQSIFLYNIVTDSVQYAALHIVINDDVAELKWLGNLGRKGAGSKLLHDGLSQAKARGAKRAKLTTKWNSEGFYLKSGFKADGETKSNPIAGSNNTEMSKTLESRLNEIESVSLGKDWGDVSNVYWNGKNSDRMFKIGRVAGLNLVIEKSSYGREMTAYLMTKEGDAVGEIQLEKEYNAWITDTTILSPDYQGQGLMLQAYVVLAKAGMILRSGGAQSAGGKKIWLALNRQPGITVYAGKEGRDGEWKYSAIDDDTDDRARGEFDIYDVDNYEVDNEYKAEVFALQARADKLSARALRATSTAEKAKFAQEYEEVNDMLAKLEAEREAANRATRAKDGAHDWEDTYLFAVADGVEPNNRF